MEFRYGDIVKILRKDEYGGISSKKYKVVDMVIDNGNDFYLLQDTDSKTLRGWHKANRLVKVGIKK